MKPPRITGNLVTAVFRHDTSRALDPHLHSHCNVFNATFDPLENRWKALENREMYAARKYAENVYYHELSRSLRGFGYRIKNKARGKHAVAGKWHPAKRISTIHHRDIAIAIQLALRGVFDDQIVNISDDAPCSLYELAALVGVKLESSAEPLESPWHLHVDSSLARRKGFQPSVRTIYQAVEEKLL